MSTLVYAKKINNSNLTGIIDVSKNPPEVFCFCTEEVSKLILNNKIKSDKWNELDNKLAIIYGEGDDDDDSETDLCDIGELCATSFGYL